MSDTNHNEHLAEGSLISHLLELRSRLVKAAAAVAIAFAPCAFFANKLFELVARPMLNQLPPGTKMISTSVVGSFMVPIKLAMICALVLAMPVILYQLWAFVAPGLYSKEKRFAIPLLLSSIILFYVGVAFAYLLAFPAAFKFLVATTPEIAEYLPEIASFLDVATLLSLVFGLAFEIPVATILLLWTGMVRISTLTQNRGYVLIGLAVFTAVVTPPDPISMLLMLIPMYLLYEVGIVVARVLLKDKIAAQAEEERQGQAAS